VNIRSAIFRSTKLRFGEYHLEPFEVIALRWLHILIASISWLSLYFVMSTA